MSVITMTGIDHLFEPNCWVVTDYHGAEMNSVCHGYNCPHKDERRSFTLYPDCVHCRQRAPLVMQEQYKGAVIRTYERNGSDDSDFYAVVWNEEQQRSETIEYASTRGWSYPNGATVDATPEILAKYRLERIEQAFKTLCGDNIEDSQAPAAGKVCRVTKGRKIAKGTEVTVLRIGEPMKYSQSRFAIATINALVKFPLNGVMTQVWTNVANLEVINPAQYLKSEAELRVEAQQLIDNGYTVMPKRLVQALNRIGR